MADFLCIEARLIVEADGPTHVGNAYDQERDRQLEAIGYLVLRFPNARIWNHIEAVLADIQSAAGR
ncbi:MAG: DUF559 domain-containing protein [Caulobacter sp.]|nr:DUF559 domain-containing protein [Caulobacter sp.]